MKKRACALLCALVLLFSSGCAELQSYRPIEDINDLDGRRVGVALAWAPDYLLTGREDMTLMRYNSIAEMVTALCYRRLDAIAVERPFCNQILQSVKGVRAVEPVIARDGMIAYIANGQEQLQEQFNTFIREFRTTQEFQDIQNRLNAPEGFIPKDVPMLGGEKVLRVGICTDGYPFAYIDFETQEYVGSDVEFIKHFANAYGYKIEFVGGDYTAMELGIVYGKTDIALSGISNLWRADVELTGKALCSEIYMETDIVFIEVADWEELEILSAITE